MENVDKLNRRVTSELMFCNEQQKRKFVAIEALSYGPGGVSFFSSITGMSQTTIRKGIKELEILTNFSIQVPVLEYSYASDEEVKQFEINYASKNNTQTSKKGRKKSEENDPNLRYWLFKIVLPYTKELDGKIYTTLSIPEIIHRLSEKGLNYSRTVITRILKNEGFDLNLKKGSFQVNNGKVVKKNNEEKNDKNNNIEPSSSNKIDCFLDDKSNLKIWKKSEKSINHRLAYPDKIRSKGGGRNTILNTETNLKSILENLLENSAYGNPEKGIVHTALSQQNLCSELKTKYSYSISQRTVGKYIKILGYSSQKNKKDLQVGKEHPDRDLQFRYIKKYKEFCKNNNIKLISIDSKCKVNVGMYENQGKRYCKKGKPVKVYDHDFVANNLEEFAKKTLNENFDKNSVDNNFEKLNTDENIKKLSQFLLNDFTGKGTIYGIYDIFNNKLSANVGFINDTADFSANSIDKWILDEDIHHKNKIISILADGGGSNGYKVRLWKFNLQKLADKYNIAFMVSHYPPGTSKFNPIEHRAFCFVSKNWSGVPLVNLKTVIGYINGTKTKKGLSCKASLDTNLYRTGIKVTDEEYSSINLFRCSFHGDWNYVICPRGTSLDDFNDVISGTKQSFYKDDMEKLKKKTIEEKQNSIKKLSEKDKMDNVKVSKMSVSIQNSDVDQNRSIQFGAKSAFFILCVCLFCYFFSLFNFTNQADKNSLQSDSYQEFNLHSRCVMSGSESEKGLTEKSSHHVIMSQIYDDKFLNIQHYNFSSIDNSRQHFSTKLCVASDLSP